jgi:hypothetical protein
MLSNSPEKLENLVHFFYNVVILQAIALKLTLLLFYRLIIGKKNCSKIDTNLIIIQGEKINIKYDIAK